MCVINVVLDKQKYSMIYFNTSLRIIISIKVACTTMWLVVSHISSRDARKLLQGMSKALFE